MWVTLMRCVGSWSKLREQTTRNNQPFDKHSPSNFPRLPLRPDSIKIIFQQWSNKGMTLPEMKLEQWENNGILLSSPSSSKSQSMSPLISGHRLLVSKCPTQTHCTGLFTKNISILMRQISLNNYITDKGISDLVPICPRTVLTRLQGGDPDPRIWHDWPRRAVWGVTPKLPIKDRDPKQQ